MIGKTLGRYPVTNPLGNSAASGWCGVVAFLIILCSAMAAAGADQDSPPFDVDRFLRDPDGGDLPWKVDVRKPRLTLQQRFLVEVRASINVGRLPERAVRRTLHFVIKVAGADNRWISGCDYTPVPVPPGLGKSHRIQYVSGVYLRPGQYTIALILYDDVLHKGNTYRKHLKVSGLKNDRLPELDRDLPDVGFISLSSHDLPWPLDKGKEWLPLNNNRGLCIDIVVNTSTLHDSDPFWRRSAPLFSMQMLEVASVLSHLRLRTGCVRVSILDISRMQTLFDREDATDFDWQRASEAVLKLDRFTIDSALLSSQSEASAYVFGKLHQIMQDSACVAEATPPLKIVIIVSSDLLFAEHTRIQKVTLQDPDSIQFFYFCVKQGRSASDDLFKMLKPTKPRRFFVPWPTNFRTALADLISSLEKLE
jgi:hypothetical protein